MAKINMMTHFDSVSGKYNRTDEVYTKIRKFDEQVIAVRLKNPITNEPPTEAQVAVQQKLTSIAAQVQTTLANPEQRAEYHAKWKKQKKVPTFVGFVFAQLYKQSNSEG